MPVLDAVITNNLQVQIIFLWNCKTLYDMYIFNYLHLKQSINTNDLKFNTNDTILNYFFTSAPMHNVCQIMSVSSFEFSTILSHVRNNNPKILLFCLKARVKTFHMIPYT